MNRERLEEALSEFPVCEYAWLDVEDVAFLEQVRYICRTECPRYNTSWSCPPAVGTVEECRQRCQSFDGVFLFTTVAEVRDIADIEETLTTRMEHEEITRQVRDLFRMQGMEILTLSTESCAICENCLYPKAPCRYPDCMFPCVESHGILVTDLAEKAGITFMQSGNVVTWFSMIFYR